ncbi:MAG: hypothetical protein N4A43_03675 [Alphaproteobacteria bacterium]|jgi:hypothetical protein|nr:hypothetical protein [Alphaproteobacteria bacterium]
MNTKKVDNEIDDILKTKGVLEQDSDESWHLRMKNLTCHQKQLVQNLIKPVGEDKAKKIINNFFSYFNEPIPESTIEEIAKDVSNTSEYAIQKGLELAGKKYGHTTKAGAIEFIDKESQLTTKIAKDCGLSETCKRCKLRSKKHSLCGKHFVHSLSS